MTRPRFIVEGRLCFVTARAVRRMFLFLPEPDVVRVFEYLLAVAAEAFGVRLHEVLCMSNHFHVLCTDVRGNLPDFMAHLDGLFARSVNALRGTNGSVFDSEYGLVAETDEDKVVEHAVYTLANPCADHLVRRSKQWPGFSTLRMEYGRAITLERPKVGLWREELVERFRKSPRGRGGKRVKRRRKPSCLPDRVELRLERPPVWMQLGDAELRAEIRAQLAARELELIERRAREGREVLGVRGVLRQRWDGFPARPDERFGTKPRVAGSLWARIAELHRLREFEDAYAEARRRFVGGERDVVWPLGTWLMRVRHGVPCVNSPP